MGWSGEKRFAKTSGSPQRFSSERVPEQEAELGHLDHSLPTWRPAYLLAQKAKRSHLVWECSFLQMQRGTGIRDAHDF